MLTSLQNPLVKQLRRLHQGKYRRSQQQFLLEGTHLVQEALAVHYPLWMVCATPDWQVRHESLWAALGEIAERQEIVSPEVLGAIATTVTPDGVVAIAQSQAQQVPDNPCPSLGIALETMQDPGNLGTIIRTATAASSDGLWVSQDSVDLEHPKVLRASAGQWFRLPMGVVPDLATQVEAWRGAGCQVLATAADAPLPYWAGDLRQPTVLLLGNEGAGLSPGLRAISTQTVSIPMAAPVESLNVGIAAAILLFEAQRQRQSA